MSKPNLPTEEEQPMTEIADNFLTAAMGGSPLNSNEENEKLQTNAYDKAISLIHHYATKRELEARIDEADKIYTNADDLACHGGSSSSIIRSIAGRKRALEAQKEQEIK